METVLVFVDGGVYPNNGVYFSVMSEYKGRAHRIHEKTHNLAYSTNNEAEYLALIAGLSEFDENEEPHRVIIHSDSQLVIFQMTGKYRVKKEHLKSLHSQAGALVSNLIEKGFTIEFEWVPREEIFSRFGH